MENVFECWRLDGRDGVEKRKTAGIRVFVAPWCFPLVLPRPGLTLNPAAKSVRHKVLLAANWIGLRH